MDSRNEVVELTIEELAEDLEILYWEKGIEAYRIKECFPKNGESTYVVNRLIMEVYDNIIYSSDRDNIIQSSIYALMAFLTDCIISIHRIVIDGVPRGILKFIDGTILIEIAQ